MPGLIVASGDKASRVTEKQTPDLHRKQGESRIKRRVAKLYKLCKRNPDKRSQV